MKYTVLLLIACLLFSCTSKAPKVYNDGFITYAPVSLTDDEKAIIRKSVERQEDRYDPAGKMLVSELNGWNYHTDALTGKFHQVRGSFSYAVSLLDLDDPKYQQRAFDVIEKTISLQDTDPASRSCGVWPYYEEEPLATKKSPIDFNWADFNAVSLLDIYMGHQDKIPADLLKKIEDALILAAKSIQKRNVSPGYTNIAIMGTYVTYVVSHLFDMPELKEYAIARLQKFYDYTQEKNGFSEYNSPTYTITALDELDRMKRHIIEPGARKTIDALYTIAWDIVAKHWHKPTAQWAGPHSRSYSTPLRSSVYGILYGASDGKIDYGYKDERSDVKIKHRIPESLLPYFLTPVYPRIQRDVFENADPQIIGICYLTNRYALSTVNRSSLWNQRRPFLAYWGTPEKPSYLQVRVLHELYDLSAATWFGDQKDNTVLSAINFATNGGDKHISIDILENGKFVAQDFRLRFEFGNTDVNKLTLPTKNDAPVSFELDGLQFNLCLYHAVFGDLKGYWEKGSNETTAWLDFVLYTGVEKVIDLEAINHAALGFSFSIAAPGDKTPKEAVKYAVKNGVLDAEWNGLKVSLPVKPDKKPRNI